MRTGGESDFAGSKKVCLRCNGKISASDAFEMGKGYAAIHYFNQGGGILYRIQ